MKKLFRSTMVLIVCLMLLSISTGSIQAAGPIPVETMATRSYSTSSSALMAPEGAPGKGPATTSGDIQALRNSTLTSSTVATPEGAVAQRKDQHSHTTDAASNGRASPEFGAPSQLSSGGPYREPFDSDRKPLTPARLDTAASTGSSVSVTSAWTTDGNGNRKSTFNPGDSIAYYGYVHNSTGGTATADFRWSVDGPGGSIASWSGSLNTSSGTWWWRLPRSIPTNASAGTYTYRLSVTYNGQTSSQSTTFTVRAGDGNVSVTSAWTTDGDGNRKSTFNPGDSIHYYGYVNNSTGRTATADFRWSVDGPGGSIASWSGSLNTSSGTWWWRLPRSIPSDAFAGTYTYRLSVTYNGQTSSESTTFTVRASDGNVSVTSAWTTDGNGNRKSTFNPGDSIAYYGYVHNSTGRTATAHFRWSVDGPGGSITSWSGNLNTGSGTWEWRLPASIPSNPSAGTYTYRLSVTYNGQTSSQSTTLTVRAGDGNVSVASAWTTDRDGNRKSTFNPGDGIAYYGQVDNSTGRTAAAHFRWSVDGPGGSITSWSGNLNTGSGTWWWRLPASIPTNACAGTYTYQLTVTYNGQTSSESTTFTVRAGDGNVRVASAWTTDRDGNRKSTFDPGDSIAYYGQVDNSTGRTATAHFRWSVDGPGGSITSWSGNLNTGSGARWWMLPGSIPSSASEGPYTYRLTVTYNGQTSSQSTTFTVRAGQRHKVVLDPGHGWWNGSQIDPGCVANGMKEKDVVLDIANRTSAILESRGIQVFMTRTGDSYQHTLSYAAQYVNQVEPDIAVSFHANAGGGTGTEGWYTVGKSTDGQSRNLAGLLASEIAARLSIRNRGAKPETSNRHGRLYIHDMNAPAALIETAFLDNDNDADLLRNRRQDFAEAIANAISAYLDK